MRIQILDKAKKKKILEELRSLGVKKIEPLLLKTGKERVRAYTGDLSKEEINHLCHLLPIEGVGVNMAKEIIDKKTGIRQVRLSLEGAHLLKDQITSRRVTLDADQEKSWFFGKDIELNKQQQDELDSDKCFVVVASYDSKDLIGTGKIGSMKEILYNYLPKERRRKN